MKRTLLTLGIMMSAAVAFAQFTPNTKWPYLLENFTKGTIYTTDMKKSEGSFNVHLAGNMLHYIGSDGRIYQSDDKNVGRVEIGSDSYIFSNHQLMQIVATEGTNLLVKLVEGDFAHMQSGTGAYGASLNSSSAQNVSSLDLGGLNTPELGKMLQEKNDGAEIPLTTKYYFLLNGQQVEASKGAVADYLGAGKADEWKAFQKTNKIKWKKEDCLAAVLRYLAK